MSASYEHYNILKRPVVTEKSYNATGAANQYTFRVASGASKQQVKRAIEAIFEVNVEQVRVINVPGKARRRGLHAGMRAGYRKAIVRLAEGQTLDMEEEA